jgi:hypothetical protein
MNQTQRKYLIDKITSRTKQKIEELKKGKLDMPNASNWVFKALLSDNLEIQSQEHILQALKTKALASREGDNWLSGDRGGWDAQRVVKLNLKDLIVLPEDYYKKMEEAQLHNKEISIQIEILQSQLDTIELRIQLASDKTLQTMINEVDDMGELSLIDTKLKLLN